MKLILTPQDLLNCQTSDIVLLGEWCKTWNNKKLWNGADPVGKSIPAKIIFIRFLALKI